MLGTVVITDASWYEFLAERPELREVNFWTPSPRREFRAETLAPVLFKLRAPRSAICGFAFFAQWSALPDWFAWEHFGLGNGCPTLEAMRAKIAHLRRGIGFQVSDVLMMIGCILLVEPTFFQPGDWVPQPSDWPVRTQSSKRYDLSSGEGERIWQDCLARARSRHGSDGLAATTSVLASPTRRFGEPLLVQPRLGQATFRVAVTDAYGRSCAVTEEHSLPALEAAHIRPFAEEGPHDVRNGLLLRSDLHRLFDRGYVTVTPRFQIEVSRRLREDFHNGRSYYPFDGQRIRAPSSTRLRPAEEFLRWHNEHTFLT